MLKKVQFVTDADMLQNELSPQQRKITEKYIYRTKCKKKKICIRRTRFCQFAISYSSV